MAAQDTAAARLTVAEPQCRVLQLTDWHTDTNPGAAVQTHHDIRAIVAATQPHLLAVTGDVWCSDDNLEAGPANMQRDLGLLGELAVPWCFTWGNHDYLTDFKTEMQTIAAAPGALMPHGDGRCNYRIEVVAGAGGPPAWHLFFLNSGARWSLPGDLAWYLDECAQVGSRTPGLAFFHLPLGNYAKALDEGRMQGYTGDPVMCWGDEDNQAAGILKAPGILRAAFCGHNHRNSAWFEEDGVCFVYGRAIGHGGFGGEVARKGATLVTLDLQGDSLHFETVFADGTREPSGR